MGEPPSGDWVPMIDDVCWFKRIAEPAMLAESWVGGYALVTAANLAAAKIQQRRRQKPYKTYRKNSHDF
jgi:hypothetical protein